MDAARTGDLPAFRALTSTHPDDALSAIRDDLGRSVVHLAALSGSVPLLTHLLVDRQQPVDPRDHDHDSPLSAACNVGHLPPPPYLIESPPASVPPARPGAPSPLHHAAYAGVPALLDLLHAHGATDLDIPSPQGPPLAWAAGKGRTASVEWLLARGVSANRGDGDAASASGAPPLVVMAAAAGELSCVMALLEAGAPPLLPAEGGLTALHVAADRLDVPLVSALLSSSLSSPTTSASTTTVTSGIAVGRDRFGEGQTPLEIAARTKTKAADRSDTDPRREIIALLLQHTTTWPADLPTDQRHTEGVLAWGNERGGGPPKSGGGGDGGGIGGSGGDGDDDDSAVSSRRAHIPSVARPDPTQALEEKRRGDEAFVSKEYAAAVAAYTSPPSSSYPYPFVLSYPYPL